MTTEKCQIFIQNQVRGDTGTLFKEETQKRFYQCKMREERVEDHIGSECYRINNNNQKIRLFPPSETKTFYPPPPTLAVLTDVSLSWSVLIRSNLLQNGLFYQPPALEPRWIILQTKERKKTQDNTKDTKSKMTKKKQ